MCENYEYSKLFIWGFVRNQSEKIQFHVHFCQIRFCHKKEKDFYSIFIDVTFQNDLNVILRSIENSAFRPFHKQDNF